MDTAVVKIRPIKLIAVIFSCITLLLLIVAVAEQEWVEVKFHDEDQKSRWGLWTLCTKGDCNSLDYEWIKVSAAFVLISVILTFAGTVCGILGLKVVIPYNNRLWYLSAGVIMGCVGVIMGCVGKCYIKGLKVVIPSNNRLWYLSAGVIMGCVGVIMGCVGKCYIMELKVVIPYNNCLWYLSAGVIMGCVGVIMGCVGKYYIRGLKVVIPYNNRLWYLSAGVIMGCVGVIMGCVALSDILALIIYPVKFKEEIMVHEDVRRWDFDWTYGFGWGAFIFSAAASVFFFIPSGTKEISRKSFSSDI
ncbi:PERP [Mytilus edulis]|uniref:PERP n=1 Tax=Mytilus edulis TaxID=6550 RepID=A0A8S3QP39_MYTED|nr:unnamed protein product [Mytilus edulis]CAG2197344.1 PERP [Mytilus edulis]